MKSFPTRPFLGVAMAAACLAAGAICPAFGGGLAAPDLSSHRAPDAPGSPVVGLEYFRLTPASLDTTYRLLVIPVRFPEDSDLGLSRTALAERVNGEAAGSVRAYWSAATYGRMSVETTLAPTVTAAHPRVYYTSEGTDNYGYGTDPDAYPHNAQGLVEEVTAAISDAVDLRRFDNNGDGIVDGLLVLHSGPRAPEVIEASTSRDLMLAHAFTTSQPVTRRDAIVFPYAIASARDPVGPWVHEMGHLLGFPDEYVANGLCPGEGVGRWSLMASGSNLGGGETPSGLDAFCRQLLGFTPVTSEGAWIDLADGAFVRAFAAGAAAGPQYFLIERQRVSDGGVEASATLVYAVNEAAVDNRSCTRPLVEVRAALCATGDLCMEYLDDTTSPNLRDADDRPTGLALDFVLDAVRVRYRSDAALRLERVRLLPVEDGGALQRIELTVRNLRLDEEVGGFALIRVLPPDLSMTLLVGESLPGTIPAGGTMVDTSWALAPIPPATTLSNLPQRLAIQFVAAAVGVQPVDTVTVVASSFGLGAGRLDEFVSRRLDTNGADPWRRDGYPWLAGPLARRVNAELVSPYFTVPDRATAALFHDWDLAALAPDVALDAAQVRVLRQLAPAVEIAPPKGWGYTVERGIGNAMGGLGALSGSGDRLHVFDLSAWAGETVRLSLRVAGDAELQESTWRVFDVSVAAAPEVTGTLRRLDSAAEGPVVEGALNNAAEWIGLFHGPAWGTPSTRYATELDASTIRAKLSELFAGDRSGLPRRFELVWGVDGAFASIVLDVDPLDPVRVLLPPGPNPTPRGQGQTWVLGVPESERGGVYRLALFSVDGRRVFEREVRIDEAGLREIAWDGRDFGGREVSPGIYFLRCRRPGGGTESARVVVIP
jgi:M6 family metalloprotease-like protein